MNVVTPAFAAATRRSRKILAIEIAGLGDLVHSLPALWALRCAYPAAELHCMVQEVNLSFLQMLPWIDKAIPYCRSIDAGIGYHLSMLRRLRAAHYDVAVDLIGSDYASAIAGLSGAGRRLIRRPGGSRSRWAWRLFASDLADVPFRTGAMYEQRLRCLQMAGFAAVEAKFNLAAAAADTIVDDLRRDAPAGYIHVSPYTKLMRKELPPVQMAELLLGLHRRFPSRRLVISCSRKSREREALAQLLPELPFQALKVFDGELSLPQLFRVIEGAALHVGGDTGTIHFAWLARTPSVSWHRQIESMNDWAPKGEQHAVLSCPSDPADYLRGIDTESLLRSAAAVIRGMPATPMDGPCEWTPAPAGDPGQPGERVEIGRPAVVAELRAC
ncbi:glycosyltransferase family 9 protein [Solimonas terrae]|uniref:Glycosyltransferase family 9 protein n=1 Tax=Solimonas terrae TaxID=1396819 RepID=A0A6M2BW64_9GAMM|nr:glycosyltransferase family 9 protein [Solimonas terrae]NGY06882.1 glycosyltransferase family 9 protein [Solimonas terrae]